MGNPNTKTTEAKAKKSDQLVEITVDDSVDKIVQLDTDGARLRFNAKPGLFRQLAADEVKKLSQFGQLAYQIARDEYNELLDEQRAEEEDLLEKITVGATMGRARQRLHIDGKQKGYVYRWIRPDEKNDFLSKNRGYAVVKDGPERTLSNDNGRGPHVVGTKGSEELILVKRPESFEAAERRVKKQKRQQQFKEMDRRYRAEVDAAGVPSIGDEAEGAWRDRVSVRDSEE